MKQDRSNMDCVACGKPLSVTAKFCGKCGAPVKRSTKAPETQAANLANPELPLVQDEAPLPDAPALAVDQSTPAESSPIPETSRNAAVDDLVIHLTPQPSLREDHALPNIDLNLETLPSPAVREALPEAAQTEAAWMHRLELHQHELKKTLEKHSLLLDFISLASQQQNHQQAQPDPNEELLHNLIEQQTQFAVQLAELQNHLQTQAPSSTSARIPEEFKLLLEKQKIEIQKSFSQGVAQNSENLASAHEAELLKVQELLKANTIAAEGIEKNLAPLIQSVNDLKTKVQALVKKADDPMAAKAKSGAKEDAPSEGGGFMIFIIGMLCGLTVVLSSLAIYNFLSHDTSGHDSAAKGHDKAASESNDKGHDKGASDSHAKPAH